LAKSLGYSRAKWERKTSGAGDKWKAATQGSAGRYADGLSEAAGVSVGPMTRAAFESGIGAVSASDFNAAVSGKGQKWQEGFQRGVGR
jgi:hypothetical protein